MPRKKIKGLYFEPRTNTWYVNKQIKGKRYHFSTGEKSRAAAERYLEQFLLRFPVNHETNELTFRDAVIRFIITSKRRNLAKDTGRLAKLFPLIADKALASIDSLTIESVINKLQSENLKANTINAYLSLIKAILNKAAREWKQDNGHYWLNGVPHFSLLDVTDSRTPYPISWREQELLFQYLAEHLKDPIKFVLNTGLRNSEVCGLRWSYLRVLPDSGIRYFVIPAAEIKNKRPRIVVLNSVTQEIIDRLWRSRTNDFVFNYKGRPMSTLRGDAWLNAVRKAALAYEKTFFISPPEEFIRLRVHCLKHTVGRRLLAAGVSGFELSSILGHAGGGISRHYSDPELLKLMAALEKIAQPSAAHTESMTMRFAGQSELPMQV